MVEKLRYTGIESIGYVPWGTHLSQLYESRQDLMDILVPYFKAGLENNEFCLWIMSESITEDNAKEAMRKAIPDFDNHLSKGNIKIVDYKDFYLEDDKVKVDTLISEWKCIEKKVLRMNYEGIRVSADESWIERKDWRDFITYEKELNSQVDGLKALVLCSYAFGNCEAGDVIDIIQNHQSVLIRKNSEWVLVESAKMREAKQKLSRANRFYSVLSKINHAVIRIREPQKLYEEACKIVVEDGLFNVAWVGIIDKCSSKVIPCAQWGYSVEEEKQLVENFLNMSLGNESLINNAIVTGRHNISNDLVSISKGMPWHQSVLNHSLNSFGVFPLIIEEEVVGIMCFYSSKHPFVDEQEISLLKDLCNDIAFAINTIEQEQERKHMEEELRHSEERYRKIFEISPEAICVHTDYIIEYANLAAARLVGADSIDYIIGKSILDFVHKDYHKVVKQRATGAIKERVSQPFMEQKFTKLDGSSIDVEVTASAFPNINKNSVVTVIRDLTERKRVEQLRKTSEENIRLLNEAREYDQLKTEFFANISHELRTPINVILSAIQLLNLYMSNDELETDSVKLEKYIYTMQQNCYRLLRLVSNIIDITKIDAGFFELQLSNNNIVSIIEDITLSVSEYVEHKGITLLFDTEVEEKIMACDAEKIERIMLNLLSNAVKFTQEGGRVTVNIYDREDKVSISIKDNGVGIPEDKMHLVFERFQQVDKSLTRSHEGSGIGLSIVKSLVELHGGEIRVESEYGNGTEFIVELPVKILEAPMETTHNAVDGHCFEKINIEFSDIYSL